MMKIGEVARLSGLSAKTIRYYESIGLIEAGLREDNGYRSYTGHTLDALKFLQRARTTGFSLEECRQLLGLYRDQDRHSVHVKSMVMEKVDQLDQQLLHLQAMRTTLLDMADRCAGDESPHCAIIDELADPVAKGGAEA